MNNLYYYIPYIYREKNTTKASIKNGGFYRLYGYDYIDGTKKSYGGSKTPLLLVVGISTNDDLIHCIKVSEIPLRVFSKLMIQIQNPVYVASLLKDIQESNHLITEKNEYDKGAKAIKIDKTGAQFYKKRIRNNALLKPYDCYRTYKTPGLQRVSEVYLNYEKLGKKIGLSIQPVGRK
jgi:hypothetical protein